MNIMERQITVGIKYNQNIHVKITCFYKSRVWSQIDSPDIQYLRVTTSKIKLIFTIEFR